MYKTPDFGPIAKRVQSAPYLTRVAAAAFLVVASLSVATASARAGTPRAPGAGSAAIDAYVEQVPTSSGSIAVGYGQHAGGHLNAHASRRLRVSGGNDVSALTEITTSAALGAPDRKLAVQARDRPQLERLLSNHLRDSGTALPSISVAALNPSGSRLVLLLLAMLAVTVIGVGASLRHEQR
jgi:hypothetical protein